MVQLSFTLPVPADARAREIGRAFVANLGLREPQKQVHARQLTKLVDLLEAEGLRDRFLLICGGPRLSNTFAKELGYDAGFGSGSTPSAVAAWIAQELVARRPA